MKRRQTSTKKRLATEGEEDMQLIQIGNPEPQKMVSVLEMFQQLAKREAEMIREGRERLKKQIETSA